MARKRYGAEQVITKLPEAKAELVARYGQALAESRTSRGSGFRVESPYPVVMQPLRPLAR